MPRPQRNRKICQRPLYDHFAPQGIADPEKVTLTVDEYEVIRWIDAEQLTHQQAAAQMDISRTTVTEIYESARSKVADCIVNGKTLVIEGGNVRVCDGDPRYGCTRNCVKRLNHPLLLAEQ